MAREQLFNAPAHPEMPLFDDFMSEFNEALPTDYPSTSRLVQALDFEMVTLRARIEARQHLTEE